jgi:hypothetical protein
MGQVTRQDIALHFIYYKSGRIQQTLRITPAIAAVVADRVWEIADVVRFLEDWQQSGIRKGQERSQEP